MVAASYASGLSLRSCFAFGAWHSIRKGFWICLPYREGGEVIEVRPSRLDSVRPEVDGPVQGEPDSTHPEGGKL